VRPTICLSAQMTKTDLTGTIFSPQVYLPDGAPIQPYRQVLHDALTFIHGVSAGLTHTIRLTAADHAECPVWTDGSNVRNTTPDGMDIL